MYNIYSLMLIASFFFGQVDVDCCYRKAMHNDELLMKLLMKTLITYDHAIAHYTLKPCVCNPNLFLHETSTSTQIKYCTRQKQKQKNKVCASVLKE